MVRIVVLFLVLLSGFFSVAQKDISNLGEVKPVESFLEYDGTQIIYALPKNIVQVEIIVKELHQYRGPYANYAGKCLNISEGVIGTNSSHYSITDIQFKRYSVVDSSRFFSIEKINPFNIPELQLNNDGVILSYNLGKGVEGYGDNSKTEVFLESEVEDVVFFDLGIKSFSEEISETLYKTVKTDTSEIEVPYTQNKSVPKSLEQNAEEAAAFIRKIRKRRAKVLMGLKDEVNEVDGSAVAEMVKGLNELEQSYLDLFLGKERVVEKKYYFEHEPEPDIMQEQVVLGYFSSQRGVSRKKSDLRRADYDPLILKLNVVGNIPKPQLKFVDNSGKDPVPIHYGLYYCIPTRVNLVLKEKNKTLAKHYMQVAQKGQVVPLPGEYLVDRKFAIEFYSETGAIKRIKHNNE